MNKETFLKKPIYPFEKSGLPFLSGLFYYPDGISLSEADLRRLDEAVSTYERQEIEREELEKLRSDNELLFSFSISKAEDSALTLEEARGLRRQAISGAGSLSEKLKDGKKLSRADHDRLEYENIIKTIKELQAENVRLEDIDSKFIKNLHQKLTAGLDIFSGILPDFELYHSGSFREEGDGTHVGGYYPPKAEEIAPSLDYLLSWLKQEKTVTAAFIFHGALYALHPFRNGNKRVCRVLEEIILKSLGYNSSNLYSVSYYYHKHKDRYYSHLLDSLQRHNLTHFSVLATEALFFSGLRVFAGALSKKKADYLEKSGLDKKIAKVIRPLIKQGELDFTRLLAFNKRKVARQTLANYLSEASAILNRRERGRHVYYSLRGRYPEEVVIADYIKLADEKGVFIPQEFIRYRRD